MSLIPNNLTKGDTVDNIIDRTTFLVRVALICCIIICSATLLISPFSDGTQSHLGTFFFFAVFYSVIWGTIPSILILMVITLDNKYRKKTRIHPVRTEAKLLTGNIAILVTTIIANALVRMSG